MMSGTVSFQVSTEMYKQLRKWGIQDHPSVDPIKLTALEDDLDYHVECFRRRLGVPSEANAKKVVDERMKNGTCTYADIALEEFCEAICAHTEEKRRGELVQLAAVIQSWIVTIDRRAQKEENNNSKPES